MRWNTTVCARFNQVLLLAIFIGCGGGEPESWSIVADVEYPASVEPLVGSLNVEGALYKSSALADSDRVGDSVPAEATNDTKTQFTLPFPTIADGTYHLQITFRAQVSSPAVGTKVMQMSICPSHVTDHVLEYCKAAAIWPACAHEFLRACKRSAPAEALKVFPPPGKDWDVETCKEQVMAYMREECEKDGVLELCEQSAAEECAKVAADTDPKGNAGVIIASLLATITVQGGQDAKVVFSATQFNLAYDDDGNGVTNLDEIVGLPTSPSLPVSSTDDPPVQGSVANPVPAPVSSPAAPSQPPAPAIQWTVRTSGVKTHLNGTAFFKDNFIAVGDFGVIRTSTDGVTWSPQSVTGASSTTHYYDVIPGSQAVVVKSFDYWVGFPNSANGLLWNVGGPVGQGKGSNAVAYGNGLFVSVGNGVIDTSADSGLTWSAQKSPVVYQLNDVTFGPGLFVAVGEFGTILSSSNGITWTLRESGIAKHIYKVAFGNGIYLAYVDDKTVLTSSDGISWSAHTLSTSLPLRYSCDLSFLKEKFWSCGMKAVSGNAILWASADGIVWSQVETAATEYLEGVAFGKNTYVAVGDFGTIVTSP